MMVMLDILSDGMLKRRFAEKDHTVEAFRFNRFHKSLRKCVQIRTSGRKDERLDSDASQNHVKCGREFRIPVANEVSTFGQQVATTAGQIPRSLPHPGVGWIASDPCNIDLAAADMNEEQTVIGDQAEGGPDFGGEEIGGQKAVSVRLDEVGPACLALPIWRGVNTVFFEDRPPSLSNICKRLIQLSQNRPII